MMAETAGGARKKGYVSWKNSEGLEN